MNIYNDYSRIKLPGLNREACSNSLGQEPCEGGREVLTNFRAHFSFPSRGIHFCGLPAGLEQRAVVKKPI